MRALQGHSQLEVAERRGRGHSFWQGWDEAGRKSADAHHQELSAWGCSRIRHGGGRTRLHRQANTRRFIHLPTYLPFNFSQILYLSIIWWYFWVLMQPVSQSGRLRSWSPWPALRSLRRKTPCLRRRSLRRTFLENGSSKERFWPDPR